MRKIGAILLMALLCGCVGDDYFGLSKDAYIISFDIEGQLSNQIKTNGDWTSEGVVTITIPSTLNISELKVDKAVCSQLAVFDSDPYVMKDFMNPVYISVTAEDNRVVKRWKIIVEYDTPSDQLAFADMKQWMLAKTQNKKDIYFTDPKDRNIKVYGYFPGNGSSLSPWQSPAESNAIAVAGIYYYTVAPSPSEVNAEFARIQTIFVNSVAATIAKAKVVTGALFTGRFLFNMNYAPVTGSNQPRKMVDIGVPFYYRPKFAVFKMRYSPGEKMMDGSGVEITSANALGRPTKDSCDVYILLQNRSNDPSKYIRVAAAALRTSESVGDFASTDGFMEVRLPFIYGKPSTAEIAEKPYIKIGGSRGELTFNKFESKNGETVIKPIDEVYATDSEIEVDNISVMFSSSAYGDSFWGAINLDGSSRRGSTLDIKDFRLEY